jgi:hypothetical protein
LSAKGDSQRGSPKGGPLRWVPRAKSAKGCPPMRFPQVGSSKGGNKEGLPKWVPEGGSAKEVPQGLSPYVGLPRGTPTGVPQVSTLRVD